VDPRLNATIGRSISRTLLRATAIARGGVRARGRVRGRAKFRAIAICLCRYAVCLAVGSCA
jgi:hypothetical protein